MEYKNEYNFIAPYITGDEFVLWKGKPEKGRIFTSHDFLMIPFSIVWFGFAIFWETGVLSSGAYLFGLFGIPFIIIGLYLTVGRFIHASYLRKRTFYVITNKKIIRLRGKKIDMLDGKAMPSMRIEIHKNGNGTIKFSDIAYRKSGFAYRDFDLDPWRNGYGMFTIENIPNVAQVQKIIESMDK